MQRLTRHVAPPRRGNPDPEDIAGWLGLVGDLGLDLKGVLSRLAEATPAGTSTCRHDAAVIVHRMRCIMEILTGLPEPKVSTRYDLAAQIADARAVVAYAGAAASICYTPKRQSGWREAVRWRVEGAAATVANLASVHACGDTAQYGRCEVPAAPPPVWRAIMREGPRAW